MTADASSAHLTEPSPVCGRGVRGLGFRCGYDPFVIADWQCVVLDCSDPVRLAEFYRSILGGAVNQPDRRWSLGSDWATLHLPSGVVLCFQQVADYRPPRWPDPAHPQQFHLDFGVADLNRAHEQVLAQGATVLDDGADGRGWRVYADPDGHPFCLVRH